MHQAECNARPGEWIVKQFTRLIVRIALVLRVVHGTRNQCAVKRARSDNGALSRWRFAVP